MPRHLWGFGKLYPNLIIWHSTPSPYFVLHKAWEFMTPDDWMLVATAAPILRHMHIFVIQHWPLYLTSAGSRPNQVPSLGFSMIGHGIWQLPLSISILTGVTYTVAGRRVYQCTSGLVTCCWCHECHLQHWPSTRLPAGWLWSCFLGMYWGHPFGWTLQMQFCFSAREEPAWLPWWPGQGADWHVGAFCQRGGSEFSCCSASFHMAVPLWYSSCQSGVGYSQGQRLPMHWSIHDIIPYGWWCCQCQHSITGHWGMGGQVPPPPPPSIMPQHCISTLPKSGICTSCIPRLTSCSLWMISMQLFTASLLYHPDSMLLFSSIFIEFLILPVGTIFGACNSLSFFTLLSETWAHMALNCTYRADDKLENLPDGTCQASASGARFDSLWMQ